ncbi:MAG: SGNH/GDSL hydrolase family protein [Actinobacteria bacterium]|nr:SGNH/GDSL hydrolase family protein [Actinomycetota bacterium]
MKRILVVGDSLAGGPPAVNFTVMLENALKDYSVNTSFVGGDPLSGVLKRCLELAPDSKADILVIEGGINDILLPVLKERGGMWSVIADRILKRGNPLTGSPDEFKALYSSALEKLKSSVPAIIPTTLTCLGEDLENRPNGMRRRYNEVIRGLSAEHNTQLADTGGSTDRFLEAVENPSQYFQDKLHGAFTDSLYTFKEKNLHKICGRRGLKLTIDGVHFNQKGARLFARTVEAVIENSQL